MPDVSKHEAVLQGLKDGTYSTLDVSFDSVKVVTGKRIPKGETKPTPTLVAPSNLPQGEYTMLSLDLDAPLISFNLLSPVAHWIQTGYKIVGGSSQELKSDDAAIAPWVACGPPPIATPHRYVFLLYEQKPGFGIPEALKEKPLGITARMRFDVDGIVKQLGLGKIVAVNYFVSN